MKRARIIASDLRHAQWAASNLRMTVFAPVRYIEGYLPIEDHGLIGDGTTTALVGRDGVISWMCVPRFDSPPLFCRILDAKRGGAFTVAPEDLAESRQFYERDTGVLVTEMRGRSGLIRLTDAFSLRSGADLNEDIPAGRSEVVRSVRVLDGRARLRIEIQPKNGAHIDAHGEVFGCAVRHIEVQLNIKGSRLVQSFDKPIELRSGDRLDLALRWGDRLSSDAYVFPDEPLKETIEAWHRWMRQFRYDGSEDALVRRSAITLKLLDYTSNGEIVAAPTSSLPELIGGTRNWDYRYAWVRDAAFSVYALRRLGFEREAARFLAWVLDAVERGGRPKVFYNLDRQQPQPEGNDPDLEGYRRSAPVPWRNAAVEQVQHDVYGEILDCAHQWAAHAGTIDSALWAKLKTLVQAARVDWNKPDHGISEVRTAGRPFTYSAALCHVALDRGAGLARRFDMLKDIGMWETAAAEIRSAILEQAWDESRQYLSEHLGGGSLDASLLSLPLRRVIPATHPKMIATTAAIGKRLSAGKGLLYRYLPEESPDGLPGQTFLLCSFWMVDNLAYPGRLDEALELYHSLCARTGNLGLLPEEIDPFSGAFLGNYPQAFSHIGVIASGVNLARLMTQTDAT